MNFRGEESAAKAALRLGLEVYFASIKRKKFIFVLIVGPIPAFPSWFGG